MISWESGKALRGASPGPGLWGGKPGVISAAGGPLAKPMHPGGKKAIALKSPQKIVNL